MIRRTIDFKDSDTQTEKMTSVDWELIAVDEWWDVCDDYANWGTYTQNHGVDDFQTGILKWSLSSPDLDERKDLLNKIKTICNEPSKYIRGNWTMSFWYQEDGNDVDYEILYTIINPTLKSDS